MTFTTAQRDAIFREARRNAAAKSLAAWGSGGCLFIAVEGILLLRDVGLKPIIQAGDTSWPRIREDQDDGVVATHFSYKWSPETPQSRAAMQAGKLPEMHVWIGLPDEGEVIDFTTGDFPQQAAQLGGYDWPGDPPPLYLWTRWLPPRVVYAPREAAIEYAVCITRSCYDAAVAALVCGR